MSNYHLPFVLHPPSEDNGWMYMAEIPVLPGCRAWGATSADALDILTSVAEGFIASYKAHDQELPEGVLASKASEAPTASERLVVAA